MSQAIFCRMKMLAWDHCLGLRPKNKNIWFRSNFKIIWESPTFWKSYTFGSFPVSITTTFSYFKNHHRRPSPGKVQNLLFFWFHLVKLEKSWSKKGHSFSKKQLIFIRLKKSLNFYSESKRTLQLFLVLLSETGQCLFRITRGNLKK